MKTFRHGFYDEFKNKIPVSIDDEGFSNIQLMKKYGLTYDFKIGDKFYSLTNIQESIDRAARSNNYSSFALLNIDSDNFFMNSDKLLVEMYQLSKLLAVALKNSRVKYITFSFS